jgi:sterol desaturase/sphingolipid hydroxylase (fatty acid hydroxylase superfamily)
MDTSFISKAIVVQHLIWNRSTAHSRNAFRGLIATRMSPLFFFLDFLIYPPLILYFLNVGLSVDSLASLLQSLAALVLALVSWSLTEYLLHRFVLHHVPLFEAMHTAHHHAPRALVGTPTLLSLAIFMGLVYWPVLEMSGQRISSACMAGLLGGYLAYTITHYAIHHWGSSGYRWAKSLKRHHGLHHHQNGNINFGVTSRLWDRIFGTLLI